ncbi:MAG: CapA family protein [Candidatus Saccharibacteria bacterium]|nr:CapA family protein [Candidatus Saccharibacteria bacterium]
MIHSFWHRYSLAKSLTIFFVLLGSLFIVYFIKTLLQPSVTENKVDKSSQDVTPDRLPDTTVSIVGDISLADNWSVMPAYDARGQGVDGILSAEALGIMRSSDLMVANSEFTVSNRGSAIPGKAYTFRANPDRLSIYDDMGVDLVTLANNHVYDFQGDAFNDMLDAFEQRNMPHIGAGRNLEEAKKAYYYKAPSGQTIAFVNASRAEKWGIDTPGATDTTGGILLCYDTADFVDTIKTAKANSDIVVAIIHWGTESSHVLEQVQIDTAKEYIDAGADMIVGGHAHTLQGIDFYNGKPIIYNLGDYIFNDMSEPTAIFQFKLSPDGELKYYFIVGWQENMYTRILSGEERQNLVNQVESWSPNITITEDNEIVLKN